MGHTPYGYVIKNGKAEVDEEKADQVRRIFLEYLSGTPLRQASINAGLNLPHTSAKRMLTNKKYLGNEYYPAIIEEDVFNKAGERLKERAKDYGWDKRGTKDNEKTVIPTAFYMEEEEEKKIENVEDVGVEEDVFKKAAYRYGRIKIKEA